MKRRAVCLFLILALLFAPALSGCRSAVPGPPRLSGLMADEAQLDRLTEGRTEDPDLISALSCNGLALLRAGGDYYYSMIEDDPDGMDPVVEAGGDRPLQLAFAQRTLDGQTLRSGEGLPFLAYSDSAYCKGILYMTTLPVMEITVTAPDESGSFEVLDREEREARMVLFDNRAARSDGDRFCRSSLTIRIRGNTSAVLPKLSYRLSLFRNSGGKQRSNDMDLLGLRSDDDWILYANGGDSERIRTCLCNNLWYGSCADNNALGVRPGVECRYVELLMNGQYMGLYALSYPLDKKQVGLPDGGFYYRGVSYLETTKEMLRRAKDETVVGGWELRYPSGEDAEGRACWARLADFFAHFYDAAENAGHTWFRKHVDQDNFIDLHLFLSLAAAMDNYYKNNNVIAYPQADGSWCYLMAPWDLDLTMGQDYSAEEPWRIAPERISPDREYNPWPRNVVRMMEGRDFQQAMRARWQTLRAGDWSDEALSALLDEYEAQIYGSGAMARERERWPDAPASEDLSELRTWLRARLAYLDGCFGAGSEP